MVLAGVDQNAPPDVISSDMDPEAGGGDFERSLLAA